MLDTRISMAELMTFQERNVNASKTTIKTQTEGEQEFMKTPKRGGEFNWKIKSEISQDLIREAKREKQHMDVIKKEKKNFGTKNVEILSASKHWTPKHLLEIQSHELFFRWNHFQLPRACLKIKVVVGWMKYREVFY